jgi:hypothetical protein
MLNNAIKTSPDQIDSILNRALIYYYLIKDKFYTEQTIKLCLIDIQNALLICKQDDCDSTNQETRLKELRKDIIKII